jgi:hypothetical protein
VLTVLLHLQRLLLWLLLLLVVVVVKCLRGSQQQAL